MAGGGGGSKKQPKAPSVPNPADVAKAQADANVQAAQETAKMAMTNQTDAYGNRQVYKEDSSSPSGYSLTTQLSPMQQAILNNEQTFGKNLTGIGIQQLTNVGDTLKNPVDLSPAAVENNLMELGLSRYTPMWNTQEDQLDTKLRNQGLVPGTKAYDDAFKNQKFAENDIINQLMLGGYNTGKDTILTARDQPLKELQYLEGVPVNTGQFANTPSPTVAPPNYGGYAYQSADLANNQYQFQQNYKQQQQQLANQQTNALYGALGGVAGSALGGWATGGFKFA